jgi:hypothetical protein
MQMSMIRLVFLIGLSISLKVESQQLIGMSKVKLKLEMDSLWPGFIIETPYLNNSYNCLKYVDQENGQTLLVFLSENDTCTSTKLMSDFANLTSVKEKLDKEYQQLGEDKWKYSLNGSTYLIILKKEEWFFSVITLKSEALSVKSNSQNN